MVPVARGEAARGRTWPIVVRRARADDRDAVLGFAANTWDGWDYIPEVWDDWLVSPDGAFLVAIVGAAAGGEPALDATGQELDVGAPVAITRIASLSTTEAWLEGIRVHPRVRGMEVASDLQVAELRWVDALGATVVRYMTGEGNEGSLRLGARQGLLPVARWRMLSHLDELGEDPADAERRRRMDRALADRRGRALRLPPGAEAGPWWAWLSNDPGMRDGHGLYELRPWSFQALTYERLATHIAAGEVLAWPVGVETPGTGSALAIVPRLDDASDQWMRVAHLCGDPDGALALVDALTHALLRGDGSDRAAVGLRLPEPSSLVAGREAEWQARGFTPAGHVSIVVERPLDAVHPLPEVDPARLVLADAPGSGGGQR